MKSINSIKCLMTALMAVISMTFIACGGDDDDDAFGGNSGGSAELIINGTSYGSIPYAYFLDEGMDGTENTGSFIFSNLNMKSGSFGDVGTKWTYLSVRVPIGSDGTIPVGSFSGSLVDADFDVNRILPNGSCDLTGWSVNVDVTVSNSGNKYIVNFDRNEFSIFQGDDEYGKGTKGLVSFHYEGEIEKINY